MCGIGGFYLPSSSSGIFEEPLESLSYLFFSLSTSLISEKSSSSYSGFHQ